MVLAGASTPPPEVDGQFVHPSKGHPGNDAAREIRAALTKMPSGVPKANSRWALVSQRAPLKPTDAFCLRFDTLTTPNFVDGYEAVSCPENPAVTLHE